LNQPLIDKGIAGEENPSYSTATAKKVSRSMPQKNKDWKLLADASQILQKPQQNFINGSSQFNCDALSPFRLLTSAFSILPECA
jgi:hypothetical protein